MATGLLCYLSGLIDVTVAGFGTLQAAGYIGISNVFLLTLFIMAAGPGSGGHVNPTITFATMVTGLTSFPRGELTFGVRADMFAVTHDMFRHFISGWSTRGSCTRWRSIARVSWS